MPETMSVDAVSSALKAQADKLPAPKDVKIESAPGTFTAFFHIRVDSPDKIDSAVAQISAALLPLDFCEYLDMGDATGAEVIKAEHANGQKLRAVGQWSLPQDRWFWHLNVAVR